MRRAVETLVGATVPDDEGSEPTRWPRWALLPAHLPAVEPAEADDPGLRGTAYHAGWYLFCRAIEEDTLARRWRVLGDDHPDTLHAAEKLSVCGGAVFSVGGMPSTPTVLRS